MAASVSEEVSKRDLWYFDQSRLPKGAESCAKIINAGSGRTLRAGDAKCDVGGFLANPHAENHLTYWRICVVGASPTTGRINFLVYLLDANKKPKYLTIECVEGNYEFSLPEEVTKNALWEIQRKDTAENFIITSVVFRVLLPDQLNGGCSKEPDVRGYQDLMLPTITNMMRLENKNAKLLQRIKVIEAKLGIG